MQEQEQPEAGRSHQRLPGKSGDARPWPIAEWPSKSIPELNDTERSRRKCRCLGRQTLSDRNHLDRVLKKTNARPECVATYEMPPNDGAKTLGGSTGGDS
jgi:hypothetical protein